MERLHSFGYAIPCGKCGAEVTVLFAVSPAAALAGEGICLDCHSRPKAGRKKAEKKEEKEEIEATVWIDVEAIKDEPGEIQESSK